MAAAADRTPFRNRIVGHGDVAPDQLLANPKNWRTHPQAQRDALEGVLDGVGWVDEVIVNERTGFMVDGHARVLIALERDEPTVPVKYVDLTDEEEALILATFDPISALAGRDDDKVRELLASVTSDDAAVSALLASIAGAAAPLPGAAAGSAPPAYDLDQLVEAGFAYFRAVGFPYRALAIHECMQELNALRATGVDALERTLTAYQVADTYHPHRFHAHAAQMKSPVTSFANDKLLRRAIRLHLESGATLTREFFGTLAIVSGTQSCSNFRPGYAALLYRRHCPPGGTVLDTSTGYGGRLVGAFASGVVGCYVGIDPSVATDAANRKMVQELDFGRLMRVVLINEPAEDVHLDTTMAERFDFAFTSPPYFAKEEYSDEPTQSWKRYATGEAWRAGFLQPMLALQFACLKAGALSAINIADVTINDASHGGGRRGRPGERTRLQFPEARLMMNDALKFALVFGAAADGVAGSAGESFDQYHAAREELSDGERETSDRFFGSDRHMFIVRQLGQVSMAHSRDGVRLTTYLAYAGVAQLFRKIAEAEGALAPAGGAEAPSAEQETAAYLVKGANGWRWSVTNQGAAERIAARQGGTVVELVERSERPNGPNAEAEQ